MAISKGRVGTPQHCISGVCLIPEDSGAQVASISLSPEINVSPRQVVNRIFVSYKSHVSRFVKTVLET